ncbi:MAG: minor capsid protein [Raoultibacter sp.]
MMKPNQRKSDAAYWSKRQKQLMAQLERDEVKLKKKLSSIYESESIRLAKEIAAYYAEYGSDDVLKYRQLLGSLKPSDRKMLIERMEDFAKKYPEYAYLLPVRESIYRLNELEGLQTSIRMQQLEIGAIEASMLEQHLASLAELSAIAATEHLDNWGLFHAYNKSVVAATVGKSWAQGTNYSESIWDNREKLASYLNDDLAKMLARGATYQECKKVLGERFENVSRSNMFRLIYTEGTYVLNEAQALTFEDEYDGYAISCADAKACRLCTRLQSAQQEEPVPYKNRNPGINFPPLHPWCRCTAVPIVNDWDEWIEGYVAKHTARDLLAEASKVENAVTHDMLSAVEATGAKLTGLDFRLKGLSSLTRKISGDLDGTVMGDAAARAGMHDVLRYTALCSEDRFADQYQRIVGDLNSKGYNVIRVRNTIDDASAPYRGVNTLVKTGDGYIFELQYHTAASIDVKERVHLLYEEFRLSSTTAKRKSELAREMSKISASLSTPTGANAIKSFGG